MLKYYVRFCLFLLLSLNLLSNSAAQEVPLEESITLPSIVVTATRQEEEIMRIPAHITIISEDDIKRSGATDVADLLRTEPGFWVTNTSGSTPSGIIIDSRGFNNGGGNGSRMLVLIDGRRSNLVDSSNPDWAVIPVESIERLEIVRGSSTALYGDNAMVGVINIITKKGSGELTLSGSLEKGSYDFQKRKASISGRNGIISYFLYGGSESTNGYRENSNYRASNYVGRFGYEISSSTTVHLRTSYLENKRLLPGSLTQDEIRLVGRRGSVTSEDNGGGHHTQFDIGFESFLTEYQHIDVTFGQTERSDGFVITFPGGGTFKQHRDSRSMGLSAKYNLSGDIARRESRFNVGIDLLKETINTDGSFQKTDYKRKLIGVYINEEFSLAPSLITTMAIRMDSSKFEFSEKLSAFSGDRSFRIWSPKGGLSYLMSPSTTLFATWSKSFRFPNADELTGVFGFTPSLNPEKAETYELGSRYHSSRFFDGTISAFFMRVEDEIIFNPAASENQNIPEVVHDGLEVSALIRNREGLSLKGSYALTRSEIKEGPFKGGKLPITPRHAGSLTLEWEPENDWTISLAGRFVGRRFLANDLANQQEKLPKYAVVNGRLSYSKDHYDAFFGVNNIFNREYEEFGGVGGFPFGSRIGVNSSPERNYLAGVTFILK